MKLDTDALTAPPEPPPPTPRGAPRQHRLTGLDALRGVAATWVMLYHYTFHYGMITGHYAIIKVHGGSEAVQLFFMISGYVISMSLRRSATATQFLGARATRLYPTFWVCMILTFLGCMLTPFEGEQKKTAVDFLANLTMLPAALFGRPEMDRVYWTLEIELKFYVLMALLFIAGLKARLVECSVILLLLAIVTAIGTRVDRTLLPDAFVAWLNLRYIVFFAFGILAYDLSERGLRIEHYVLLALIMVERFCAAGFGAEAFTIVLAAGFVAALSGRFHIFHAKPLLFLGGISYPLYLCHEALGVGMIDRLRKAGINLNLAIALTIIAAIGLATAISFGVERPTMRFFRNRRTPRPARLRTAAT